MKNMKAMKGRAKAAISLLQDLHVLHGENTNVFFISLLIAPLQMCLVYWATHFCKAKKKPARKLAGFCLSRF